MAYKREKRLSHNKELRLAVTTGDPSGIGPIIVSLALKKLKPKKNIQFVVFTDKSEKTLKIPGFKVLKFKSLNQALRQDFSGKVLLEIKTKSPFEQLNLASRACLKKETFALITAPVKKSLLKGFKGQTDLLKKRSKARYAYMSFKGSFFNCVLFTDHIPLKKINLREQELEACLKISLKSRKYLNKGMQKKPLGLLGLNPHAGEGGLLGKEEKARF